MMRCKTLAVGLCLVGLSTGMGMGTGIAQDKEAPGAWPRWSVAFIAHRGLAPGYPENTLAAYREAIKLGAEALEIDLRGTKDGEVVILHDETLERTTDGTGKVTDKTLAELKRLDAGKGERIPTYEEVLQLVNGTGVKILLDIKESPVLDKKRIVDLTEKHNAVLNVIVGPRNLADLRTFRSLNPNLRTLGFIAKTDDIEPFAQAGVDIIRLWPKWIYAEPHLVAKVHGLGRPVWTTANDAPREELEKLVKLGVNGILTDLPDVMGAMLRDMRGARGL
jgi:glycerophosphoryl diester phosphodiesterase